MSDQENDKLKNAKYAYRNLPSNAKDSEKETFFDAIITNCKTADDCKWAVRNAPTDKSKTAALAKMNTL